MKNKIGLVLSGGGIRGISYIPIIEKIDELGIKPDIITGVSAGAIFGALYCLGKLKEFKEDYLKLTKKKLLTNFDVVFSRSGLVKGNKAIEYLKKFIPEDANIQDLKQKLAIIAVDYETGEEVVFTKGNILTAIRASISLPGIFIPAKNNKTILMDGGIANPLPISTAKNMGAEKIIAIALFPRFKKKERKYFKATKYKRTTKIRQNLKEIINKRIKDEHHKEKIMSWLDYDKEKMPNMFQAMTRSLAIMQYHMSRQIIKEYSPDLILEPNVKEIKVLDIRKIKKAYEIGKRYAEEKEEYIKTILK